MKRDYPTIYSQRDSRWSNQRLGTVDGATIGLYGCYVTCFAMKAEYYGHDVTPAQLDDMFTTDGDYQNGDLLYPEAITKVFQDISIVDIKQYIDIPADLNLLKQYAQDPSLTITLCIDFDHNPKDGVQTHFVELHSYDDTSLCIYDPWYGQEEDFVDFYGDNPTQTIQGFAVYKGPINSSTTTMSDQDMKDIASMQALRQHNSAYVDSTAILADLSTKDKAIGEKDTTISHLGDTINQKNGEIASLQATNSGLQSQVLTLQDQVNTLTEQAKKVPDLTQQVGELENQKKLWASQEQAYLAQIKELSLANPHGAVSATVWRLSIILQQIGI